MNKMKKQLFDDFCTSLLRTTLSNLMDHADYTTDECLNSILEMAHEGDRASQTITALILRQDGKAESTWSSWLSRAVDDNDADESMLAYGVYLYSISDTSASEHSYFRDQNYALASTYIYQCVKAGLEPAHDMQAAIVEEFAIHCNSSKHAYTGINVDMHGDAAGVASRIYFEMVCILLDVRLHGVADNGLADDHDDEQDSGSQPDLMSIAAEYPTDTRNNFYSAPNLPRAKIEAFANKSGYAAADSEILFFFDDTLFGKGDCGVLIDEENVVIKLPMEEVSVVPLNKIRQVEIDGVFNKSIVLYRVDGTKKRFTLTQSNKGATTLHDVLARLIDLGE